MKPETDEKTDEKADEQPDDKTDGGETDDKQSDITDMLI